MAKKEEKKPFGDTQGRPNILSSRVTRYRQANISAYARGGRLRDAEHQPHRQGRHDFHRLLRRE